MKRKIGYALSFLVLLIIGFNISDINNYLFEKIELMKINHNVAKYEREDREMNNGQPISYVTKNEPAQLNKKVLSISGNGKRNTDYFQTNSDKIKIVYKYKSDTKLAFFSVFVVEKGYDLEKKGGVPELVLNESGDSEAFVYRKPGTYYLSISGNGKWSVDIYE